MQAVVNGLLTTYTRSGKGKTLVLVHGWGDSAATYRGLEAKLNERYETINVDLPGFGQTQAPSEVWDLGDYAQFLAAFVTKIGAQPYAYVGHSNGGAVLIYGVGTNTLTSSKLILLASSGIRTGSSIKREIVKVVAKVGKVATRPLPLAMRQRLRKKLYGAVGSDMLVMPHLQETFKQTVRQDVQQEATQITTPTLLIYGKQDTATPPHDGEVYAKLIPHAQLKLIDGASHYVHQEAPDDVLRAMEEFLQ